MFTSQPLQYVAAPNYSHNTLEEGRLFRISSDSDHSVTRRYLYYGVVFVLIFFGLLEIIAAILYKGDVNESCDSLYPMVAVVVGGVLNLLFSIAAIISPMCKENNIVSECL